SSILTINIKIELIFFLRKNYCPTLIFCLIIFYKNNHINEYIVFTYNLYYNSNKLNRGVFL
ncbi:hypothetical protein, partial [Enterococcus hirae]